MTAQRDQIRTWCNLCIAYQKTITVTMYAELYGSSRNAKAAGRKITQSFSALRADDRKITQTKLKNPMAKGMFDCIMCQTFEVPNSQDWCVKFIYVDEAMNNAMFDVMIGDEKLSSIAPEAHALIMAEQFPTKQDDLANLSVNEMDFGDDND